MGMHFVEWLHMQRVRFLAAGSCVATQAGIVCCKNLKITFVDET